MEPTSDDDDRMPFEFTDTRETPEQDLLRNEAETAAANFVDGFLKTLNKSVRGKAKQYDRMINVLMASAILSRTTGTQLGVAEMLGVSDSLVSDYRKRIKRTCSSFHSAELISTAVRESP